MKSLWKCVRVFEGVCEIVCKDHKWVSQIMYMLLDTQMFELGWKMAKIAKSVWKLCEVCGRMCEEVCEIVRKFHHWVSQLIYMLQDTQCIEMRQTLAKIAQSVLNVC